MNLDPAPGLLRTVLSIRMNRRTPVAHRINGVRQNGFKIVIPHDGREVDESDRPIDLVDVEKWKQLLITQHLQRRLTQGRDEQRALFRPSQRKHDLVRKCRLAAAWRAANQIQ